MEGKEALEGKQSRKEVLVGKGMGEKMKSPSNINTREGLEQKEPEMKFYQRHRPAGKNLYPEKKGAIRRKDQRNTS